MIRAVLRKFTSRSHMANEFDWNEGPNKIAKGREKNTSHLLSVCYLNDALKLVANRIVISIASGHTSYRGNFSGKFHMLNYMMTTELKALTE